MQFFLILNSKFFILNPMDILEEIQKFETDFIKAGELACKLRDTATSSQKFNTGFSEIDIVTSADLEVQEFILSKLANSKLKDCEIIAEENTPTAAKFAKKSQFVLTLDPIDGTKLYATGKKMFSVVVTIHDKKRPIYTFCYYPAVRWGVKIVNDKIEYIGKKPAVELNSTDPKKSITYWDRPGKLGPEKTDPKVYKELTNKGYNFIKTDEICVESGIKALFLLGLTGGTFQENGSAVDSLTEYHFALANGFKIYGKLDLSKPAPSPRGNYFCYLGYYFAVKNK